MQVFIMALALAQWLQLAAALKLWPLPNIHELVVDQRLHARDSNDTASQTSKASKTTSSISIDPNLPAGGVNLKTPVSTSTTYVKAGATVTFGWNYTSLIVTPSAINIEAWCSQNSQTYTIAKNQSAKSTSAVWDTNDASDNGLHLITAEYTLVIYDAGSSPSAVPSAGYLGPFQFTFGVYLPQKYQPWPQNAKYVNLAVPVRPALLSTALAAVSVAFAVLI